MATTRSFPTQNPLGLSIADARRVLSGLVARNVDGTPRAGVLPAHANPLVTGRASMGYDVAPFVAASSRLNTGIELIANDAVTIVPTTAAPASNSRIDVIWVRSQFATPVAADTNNDVVFGVTQGNPAGVPSKPVIPPGALELATATILSSTTTTATVVITQTHPYTAAAGGVVWLRNQDEQDAWAPANGAEAYRLDTGIYLARRGGAWVRLLGAMSAMMKRSTVGTNISADSWNQHLSANNLWVEDWRDSGIEAFNNGWKIPIAGEWEIEWGICARANISAGITVNKTAFTAFSDFVGQGNGTLNQGLAFLNAQKRLRLAAGDIIRIFGAAGTAAAWDTPTTGAPSWFGIRYVGA